MGDVSKVAVLVPSSTMNYHATLLWRPPTCIAIIQRSSFLDVGVSSMSFARHWELLRAC